MDELLRRLLAEKDRLREAERQADLADPTRKQLREIEEWATPSGDPPPLPRSGDPAPLSTIPRHQELVARVERHFSERGAGGLPPFARFYEPLGITARAFSAWKKEDWNVCTKRQRGLLDEAASKLS